MTRDRALQVLGLLALLWVIALIALGSWGCVIELGGTYYNHPKGVVVNPQPSPATQPDQYELGFPPLNPHEEL